MMDDKMYAYKYVGSNPPKCEICKAGEKHFYMTKNHKVIVGSKEDLLKFPLPLAEVVPYDTTKSDLTEAVWIRMLWWEVNQGSA